MKRLMITLLLLAVADSLTAPCQSNDRSARINFEIVKAFNDKPIHNAYIVLHPVGKNGKQGKSGIELKTDTDGKTFFEGYPFGKVRIQVIAEGYQTYGQDIDINQPVHELHIKMERPKEQYSIYSDNKDNKQAKPKDSPKPDTAKPDASKPAPPPDELKQTTPKPPGA